MKVNEITEASWATKATRFMKHGVNAMVDVSDGFMGTNTKKFDMSKRPDVTKNLLKVVNVFNRYWKEITQQFYEKWLLNNNSVTENDVKDKLIETLETMFGVDVNDFMLRSYISKLANITFNEIKSKSDKYDDNTKLQEMVKKLIFAVIKVRVENGTNSNTTDTTDADTNGNIYDIEIGDTFEISTVAVSLRSGRITVMSFAQDPAVWYKVITPPDTDPTEFGLGAKITDDTTLDLIKAEAHNSPGNPSFIRRRNVTRIDPQDQFKFILA